jgi:mono/diheme cytochrome c family protein
MCLRWLGLLLVLGLLGGCRTPPLPPDVTHVQVAQGKLLYAANCASCHGPQGEGQDWRTPVAPGLLPAPAHNREGHTWHHPTQQLLEIIADGGKTPGSTMPAFKDRLTETQQRAILAYIKALWGPAEQARQAELTRQNMSDHR